MSVVVVFDTVLGIWLVNLRAAAHWPRDLVLPLHLHVVIGL